MVTNPTSSLSRSIDHLGYLGTRLRDLQGYATLAHELIQNADDAPANWMSFDVQRDALILDNNGVFSNCGNIEVRQCPWIRSGIHNHQCDFHRFRSINSGDKRSQEGTTGAFGIGFISVYQLTDRPELISVGQHWILHEEESEDNRIKVCSGCPKCSEPGLPGTRFIFPFACEERSPLRLELQADPVPVDVTERMLEELERSLPTAMLFLKNIKSIGVKESGILLRRFERECEDDTIIISQGSPGNDRVWRMFQGDFQSEAECLRHRHSGRIEEKRSANVMVALPDEKMSVGLLCACLPTEEAPGLPFHINADFFTSNDRKRVILGNDYQAQWNRKALLAAARTVARETPRLTGMLGAKRFWHIVSTLNDLNVNSGEGNCDSVWAEFWEILEVDLRKEAVILTSSGDWTTVSSGVTILQQREEANNIHVLQGLGLDPVSEDLRSYQSILRSIGVPFFNIKTLCSALTANGLNEPKSLKELPGCLISGTGRAVLWSEINILLQRQETTHHAKHADEEILRAVSLAPTVDKVLRPCKDTFCADAPTTVSLFESLGLDIPFLDDKEAAFEPLSYLCNKFEARNAIQALEKEDIVTIQQRWTEGAFPTPELIKWFAKQRDQIVNDEDTRKRLAKLSIYPSANRKLCPLTELVLPGDFKDQFGLATLVDVEALERQREFLIDLGVRKLDFRTYVLGYLSKALDNESLDQEVRSSALTLLANRFDELKEDDEVCQKLSSIRLIRCTDGKIRRSNECYFPTDTVQVVLGADANIVLDEREGPVRELFKRLGVASEPRLRDVVLAVRGTADGPCSVTAVDRMRKVVDYLGRRFEDTKENLELNSLKSIAWLPARGDTSQWHKPDFLYAPFRSYLFESQAKILDIPPQNLNSSFLKFLGIRIEPSPDLVVRHLLHCADHEKPVNDEVYRFLDEHFDDPAIPKLKSEKCLYLGCAYRSPDNVFLGEHPFGPYRWRLSDDLSLRYGRLLKTIGVSHEPDHEDALRVLHEISSEFGDTNRRLGDEEYAVLIGCWQMCEKALEQGTMSDQCLGDLRETKCISNKDRDLYPPTWLFFENRVGLAAKFGAFLEKNVIPHQPKVERAFLAAGVRPLGSAVKVQLLRHETPGDDPHTIHRLDQRYNEIARVLFPHLTPQEFESACERLCNLKCKSATLLEFRFSLNAFKRYLESQSETGSALYDPAEHLLWTTQRDDQIHWASLARELAIALCPEKDTGPLASGLKDVVAANTADEAARVLDELCFAQLDTTDVVPPPNVKAEQQLGTNVGVEDGGLTLHSSEDEAQQDMGPKDDSENLTMKNKMPQPDITPSRTVLVPEASEPTSPSGTGRSRTNAQRNGPASRTSGHGTGARRKGKSGGRWEFTSYVAVRTADEDESDPDHLPRQERMDLEEKSIKLILKAEPELKRTPKNNPGFDLIQLGPDGQPVKLVEVKAMKTTTLDDHPVTLTRTQFECAQKHSEAYWLYVVENAAAPEHTQIVRIQNPAGRAQRFTFDHGWREVSEETIRNSI